MALQPEKSRNNRKPNWTTDENLLLVQLVTQDSHKNVLRGKFCQKVSSDTKRTTWQNIATQLSVSFPHVKRTAEECEKKWYNVLSKSRQEISAYRRQLTGTGGGPRTTSLSAVADTIQSILGEDNVSISGIGDGLDTSFLQIIDMTSSLDNEEPLQESFAQDIPSLLPVSCATNTTTATTTSSEQVTRTNCVDYMSRKRQLELQVLEAQLEYYTLKIKKIRNEQ